MTARKKELDQTLKWNESGSEMIALWRSESGHPPPRRVVAADDSMKADAAYRLACEGTALLWRGDFQNARQLLNAMARRADRRPVKSAPMPEGFHLHRLARSQRSRILSMLVIPFDPGHVIRLRRAPDVREACLEAHGESDLPYVASLRELLGIIGAHEWRKKGVFIRELAERIHPHYGVFSPVRGEYLELVAKAPLPEALKSHSIAFDIGTGTGVLAALLAKRGIARIIATDQDERALACARENISGMGLEEKIELVRKDLFPEGRASLIVCNPPWVPARPSSALEHAVYDPESRMLKGYLEGLASHLEEKGEGWLILSDLAEHLKLRERSELLAMIENAGLAVFGKLDARPHHPKVGDTADALHEARRLEVTSLWRLGLRPR